MQLEGRHYFDVFEWKKRDHRTIDIVLRDQKTGAEIALAHSTNTGPFSKRETEYQLQLKVKEAFQDWLGLEGLT